MSTQEIAGLKSAGSFLLRVCYLCSQHFLVKILYRGWSVLGVAHELSLSSYPPLSGDCARRCGNVIVSFQQEDEGKKLSRRSSIRDAMGRFIRHFRRHGKHSKKGASRAESTWSLPTNLDSSYSSSDYFVSESDVISCE